MSWSKKIYRKMMKKWENGKAMAKCLLLISTDSDFSQYDQRIMPSFYLQRCSAIKTSEGLSGSLLVVSLESSMSALWAPTHWFDPQLGQTLSCEK